MSNLKKSEGQEPQAKQGWSFNLNKVPNRESLKDPIGYKSSIADVVVTSAAGKKNLT